MKNFYFFLSLTINFTIYSQQTRILDTNFEKALIVLGLDSAIDSYVATENISDITNLNLAGKNISNFTGIEDFKALKKLDISNNKITVLDLSKNTNLEDLTITRAFLNSIDVTKNTNLVRLVLWQNNLSKIDLTQNTKLQLVSLSINNLENLDVTKNTELLRLSFKSNLISEIDVSKNTKLTHLSIHENRLKELDVSKNIALERLFCYNNNIEQLNMSNNTKLVYLKCYNNKLTALNVKNGNNKSIFNFEAQNNKNLTCIQVDDVSYSNGSNWIKDSTASYKENCDSLSRNKEEFNNIAFRKINQNSLKIKGLNGEGKVTLYSLYGQVILSKKVSNLNNTLNIKGLSSGSVYLIRLEMPEGKIVKKIII